MNVDREHIIKSRSCSFSFVLDVLHLGQSMHYRAVSFNDTARCAVLYHCIIMFNDTARRAVARLPSWLDKQLNTLEMGT